MTSPLHAVALAVAVDADGPLAGALILGEAGTGKSSLALAAIEGCPWRRTALVADDAVLIDDAFVARAPNKLSGLIEIRGFGPLPIRSAQSVRLRLAAEIGASERVPEAREFRVGEGVTLPIYPFRWTGAEATAAHRLRALIRAVLSGQWP